MNPTIGVTTTTPCDEWEGGLRHGYGQIRVGKKSLGTHRLVMMQEVGHLESWQYVCHRCDNKKCIRLDHLFVGSQTDNMRDRDVKGRNYETQKTHCPSGHEYTAENTFTYKEGWRKCRICHRLHGAKSKQSARQQLLKEQAK